MLTGSAIGPLLVVIVFAIALGTMTAECLRYACALYNKLAGKEATGSVPKPSFSYGLIIIFVTAFVQGVGALVIGLLVGTTDSLAGARVGNWEISAQFLALPISLLTMASVISALLPTTFFRGILITLLYLLILTVIVSVIAILVGGVYLILFRRPLFR